MRTFHEKYSDSLIISRLQQIEIANIKQGLNVDSPFFHLVTTAHLRPFFDNLPLHLGFEFRLIGSKILGITLTRGYFYHDLETRLSKCRNVNAFSTIARLNLAAPIFYQAALYAAYMRLLGLAIPAKHGQFFTMAMEFSRVAHHLSVIKSVLHCLKLSSLSEIVVDCEEILRPAFRLFCRVRTPSDKEISPLSFSETSELLIDALARVEELALALGLEEKIRAALQKKAVVSLTHAGSMGLTGMYLRANQDNYDLRKRGEFGFSYGKPPITSIGEGGDAWTRFSLRSAEIMASLTWLQQNLVHTDSERSHYQALVIEEDFIKDAPSNAFAYGEVEGPEGDIKVTIFMRSDGTAFFRLRTPAYFIAQAIPHMLNHLDLKDVAILLFSLGITAEEIDK